MNQQYTRPYGDEIDLVDLYLGLSRHWKGMFLTFVVVLGLSVGAAFWISPKYQYQAVVALGGDSSGDGVKTFAAPESVQSAIESAYLPAVVTELKDQYPGVGKLSLTTEVPKGADVVVLSTKAGIRKVAMAKALLQTLGSKVIQAQQSQYDARVASIKSSYQTRINAVEARIASLQEGIHAKGLEPADKAQMVDQLEILNEHKVNLTEAMQNSLDSLQPTKLVAGVSRSPKPTGVSGFIVVILGGVLGVMFALFSGLMLMFKDAVKARRASA